MKEGKITLSQKQLKTLTVINRFIDKSISRQQAAELLDLSPRQIPRLKKGVLTSGAESLIHKNTGRKPQKEKNSSPHPPAKTQTTSLPAHSARCHALRMVWRQRQICPSWRHW